MSNVVIKVENLSKQYRLGQVGTGTLSHDLNRWWHRVRGKEDPYLKIGEVNDRANSGKSEYVWALKDINFEVKRGEVLGIIGKNGAGKSTLLKLLSKVTGPTTGSIKAKGRIASLLEVGTGFHPELTGRENIYLNGTILGMTKAEVDRKLDEIVDFAGVERYLDTPVKRYSSGMKVRLGFAVAAHLEPEILIVDEVLAVGDAEFQKKAVGKMKEVSEGGRRTVLFVSHNMVSIQNLCTYCVLLKDGIVQQHGNTNEVVDYYYESIRETEHAKNMISVERTGNKKIFLNSVTFHDKDENKLGDLVCGSDVYCHIRYSAEEQYPSSRVQLSIGFRDSLGRVVFRCPTNLVEFKSTFEKEGELVLVIPKFPLTPGTYFYNMFVSVDNEISDWIQNCGRFRVRPGDFYLTGRISPSINSSVFVDYKWQKK